MADVPEITVRHVQAVNDAAYAFEQGAAKRLGKMPTSAESMRGTAKQLREVQAFLLQFIPENQRASYLRLVPPSS